MGESGSMWVWQPCSIVSLCMSVGGQEGGECVIVGVWVLLCV